MNNRWKSLAVAILIAGFSLFADKASAQFGYNCNPGYRTGYGVGYGVGYGSYNYGYVAPVGFGYSSYYAGYPGYSAPFVPRIYGGTSLYGSPGFYSTARVVVPAYPVYRPVIVPTPFGPVPRGVRVGF